MVAIALAGLAFGAATAGTPTPVAAQGPTTGDPVADKLCLDILSLGSMNDLTRFHLSSRYKETKEARWAAESAYRAAREKYEASLDRVMKELKKANDQLTASEVELSSLLTSYPRLEDFPREREKLEAELRQIAELERLYEDAKQRLAIFGKGTIGDQQTARTKAEAEREVQTRALIVQRANKPEVIDRLKRMTAAQVEKQSRHDGLRQTIAAQKLEVRRLESNRDAFSRPLDQAKADWAAASLRDETMNRCIAQRRVELDPKLSREAKWIDDKLDQSEKAIAAIEASPLLPRCAAFDATAKSILGAANQLGAQADALAGRARGQNAATPQRQSESANKALADARAAAARLTSLRGDSSRAQKAACGASQRIVANPSDPASAAALVEAQRNWAQADSNARVAAGILAEIRAAQAAGRASSTPSATTDLTSEVNALKGKGADLENQRSAFNGAAAEVAALNRRITNVQGDVFQLESNAQIARESIEAMRELRIAGLARRLRAIGPACIGAAGLAGTLDGPVAAAIAKVKAAESAVFVKTTISGPPEVTGQIGAILTSATADAEAMESDALIARRCEAAARTALASKPAPPSTSSKPRADEAPKETNKDPPKEATPPKLPAGAVTAAIPGKPGGSSCRYAKGTSSIEFIIYDRPCPPNIEDYPLTGSKRVEVSSSTEKDYGDKAQDFTGKWVDKRDQWWTFTITNGKASRFPISAQSVYVAADNGVSKWSGTCIRTAENKAECDGTGTWDDTLRTMAFKVKVVMYVHSGTTITYDYEFLTSEMVRAKLPTSRPGGMGVGKFKGNPLTKQ